MWLTRSGVFRGFWFCVGMGLGGCGDGQIRKFGRKVNPYRVELCCQYNTVSKRKKKVQVYLSTKHPSHLPSLQRAPRPRKRLKNRTIILSNLRTVERRKHRLQNSHQLLDRNKHIAHKPPQQIRRTFHSGREGEAHQVVPFEQVLGVEHVAGEIVDVDAGEGVGGTCVAAEAD